MALVDWEAVCLDLEDHIRSRNSHGQRELLAKLAEARSKHRQIEGLPEKALRLYGSELYEGLRSHSPSDSGDVEPDVMEEDSLNRSDLTVPKENHEQHRRPAAIR